MMRTNLQIRTRANGARGQLSGLLLAALLLPAGTVLAQEGPTRDSGDTVARPKPSVESTPDVTDQTKIPSKLNKKADAPGPARAATFRANITTVNVDVGVLDNKGRFIPGIPAGNFRIMEDGVPQKILHASTGETPITSEHGGRVFGALPGVLFLWLVHDAAGGLYLSSDVETGGPGGRGGVRFANDHPLRLQHQPPGHPGGAGAPADPRVQRVQHVRRAHRGRRSHEARSRAARRSFTSAAAGTPFRRSRWTSAAANCRPLECRSTRWTHSNCRPCTCRGCESSTFCRPRMN